MTHNVVNEVKDLIEIPYNSENNVLFLVKFNRMKFLKTWCCFSFLLCFGIANASSLATGTMMKPDTILPKAFLLGDHERQFEKLTMEYETLLLTATDNNMNLAFNKWVTMITEMEDYSESIGYDLKGIKMWMNIFWEEDGTIAHIAFFLKPNSRNVDVEELKAFFSSFARHYTFPLLYKTKYSHYGSASFPTFTGKKKVGAY